MGGGVDITILMWEELTAVGTILLAVATFVAVFIEPISNLIRSADVIIEPSVTEYNPGNKNNYFVTQEAKGSRPLHIWVRIMIKNVGKSMAKDVFVRVISLNRIYPQKQDVGFPIIPFNPFRLRWVSEDVNYGNLINNEPTYLNLCTLVGQYNLVEASNSAYVIPVIVPGIPGNIENGNILGQGQVAGIKLVHTNLVSLRATDTS